MLSVPSFHFLIKADGEKEGRIKVERGREGSQTASTSKTDPKTTLIPNSLLHQRLKLNGKRKERQRDVSCSENVQRNKSRRFIYTSQSTGYSSLPRYKKKKKENTGILTVQ